MTVVQILQTYAVVLQRAYHPAGVSGVLGLASFGLKEGSVGEVVILKFRTVLEL